MLSKIRKFAVKNKITYELVYICFLMYRFFISFLFFIMRLFPVKSDKVVFSSAKGSRYGDNPMYISDELLKRNKNYELVWLLNKNVKVDIPDGIRRCDYSLLSMIKELSTAKVWVDSNMKFAGFLKRKGQLYIQTWHGSYGIKKIAKDLGDKLPKIDRYNYIYNAKRTDIMVSNSRRTSEIYKNAFWYDGEILEFGSPRNDLFFREQKECIERVQSYFGFHDKKIVLYAPTFRNDYNVECLKLDYTNLLDSLKNRYGGEWVALVRLHPFNMKDAADFITYTDDVLNATDYSIMQDLLVASDVLITDYSSCMLDFATTKKPCFLYATDIDKYKEDRDNYYELEDLPFPVARNNQELSMIIDSFDETNYKEQVTNLFDSVGLNETGHASEKVADYIVAWIEGDNI